MDARFRIPLCRTLSHLDGRAEIPCRITHLGQRRAGRNPWRRRLATVIVITDGQTRSRRSWLPAETLCAAAKLVAPQHSCRTSLAKTFQNQWISVLNRCIRSRTCSGNKGARTLVRYLRAGTSFEEQMKRPSPQCNPCAVSRCHSVTPLALCVGQRELFLGRVDRPLRLVGVERVGPLLIGRTGVVLIV
jgi:hypothetical protein